MVKQNNTLRLNDIKARNVLALLTLFLEQDELSRRELALRMKCDNTTVTRAVRDLLGRGLIQSSGKKELAQGRPREMLRLNPDGRYVVGISLAPDHIAGVMTDLRGRVKLREKIFFPLGHNRKLFLENLEAVAQRLLTAAGDKFCGMGLAAFGSFSGGEGTLRNVANFPELNDFNLKEFFQCRFGVVPEISDVIFSRLHYELLMSPGYRSGNTMLIMAGAGVGMALAGNGQILFNRHRHGGELGHNICEIDGLPCACGRRGCLETRCSIEALTGRVREKLKQPDLTFGQTVKLYQAENPQVIEEVETVSKFLGVAIANQVNNLMPDNLIFTGDLLRLGERFAASLKANIESLLFPLGAEMLKISFHESGDDSEPVGAALFATVKLLNDINEFERCCPSLEADTAT